MTRRLRGPSGSAVRLPRHPPPPRQATSTDSRPPRPPLSPFSRLARLNARVTVLCKHRRLLSPATTPNTHGAATAFLRWRESSYGTGSGNGWTEAPALSPKPAPAQARACSVGRSGVGRGLWISVPGTTLLSMAVIKRWIKLQSLAVSVRIPPLPDEFGLSLWLGW